MFILVRALSEAASTRGADRHCLWPGSRLLRRPDCLQAKIKDSEEGKGKQAANIGTEISLPHRASDMDELDIVIKLHRVERHIRKNKLKVLSRTVIEDRHFIPVHAACTLT